ncbi:MAG: hypothetical protein Q9190_001288 [Brigantiaea leucoxantha]
MVSNEPEYASNIAFPPLTPRPLIETLFVNVVTACSFAPYNLFAIRIKLCKADRAVTSNFFSIRRRLRRRQRRRGNRSLGKDFAQFGRKKSELVFKVLRSFENVVQNLGDTMLILPVVPAISKVSSGVSSEPFEKRPMTNILSEIHE